MYLRNGVVDKAQFCFGALERVNAIALTSSSMNTVGY